MGGKGKEAPSIHALIDMMVAVGELMCKLTVCGREVGVERRRRNVCGDGGCGWGGVVVDVYFSLLFVAGRLC